MFRPDLGLCCDRIRSVLVPIPYYKPAPDKRLDTMSLLTYLLSHPVRQIEKSLVWLHGEVKSPPLSREARMEAGYLLRLVQDGRSLRMPWSRPMPSIGPRCHELRIIDVSGTWRIIYRVDSDAIVIADVF